MHTKNVPRGSITIRDPNPPLNCRTRAPTFLNERDKDKEPLLFLLLSGLWLLEMSEFFVISSPHSPFNRPKRLMYVRQSCMLF